jgi:hypothetical protein
MSNGRIGPVVFAVRGNLRRWRDSKVWDCLSKSRFVWKMGWLVADSSRCRFVLGLGRGFIYVWGKCAVERCGSDSIAKCRMLGCWEGVPSLGGLRGYE